MTAAEDLMSHIVQLYSISKIPNKGPWTFDELFNERFPDKQSDETLRIARFKRALDMLKQKGALQFKKNYSEIMLDSIKLCLLTTNNDLNADDLVKRSMDSKEGCYKQNFEKI